jgi:hypothetical protein
MKNLKPGTRIVLNYQRYVLALWFGTGVIVSYDSHCEDYVIDRDPGTSVDQLAPQRQIWPEHHIRSAKYQTDVLPDERVLPGVYPNEARRLVGLGYIKGKHFEVPLEPTDEMI